MGQARLRGTFEERKKLAEFYANENERLQCWLRANKPKETKQERDARVQFNILQAMANRFYRSF